MGRISKWFNRSEIECKCGCGMDSMDIETLWIADEIRDYVGKSIIPSSGCRCIQHNRAIAIKSVLQDKRFVFTEKVKLIIGITNGSKDGSQHVKARAMDLPVNNPKDVYTWLCKKYPGKFGFGLYETFVHIDTATGDKRRW